MALEGFCRRQLRWDARLSARIVSADRAIGMFTTPPLGVLVFAAVPVTAPPDEPVDRVVALADWADLLRDRPHDALDVSGLPEAKVPVSAGVTLRDLPPSHGWQVPIFAVSGDLVPLVSEATAEFEARSKGLPPRGQQDVADEIWDRPAWAGLPLRVLHAARQLGMLSEDRLRVSASTCGAWKRFSTPRGQVFVRDAGPAGRLTLKLAF